MNFFKITVLLVALASIAQAGKLCTKINCLSSIDYQSENDKVSELRNSLENAKPEDTIKEDENQTTNTESIPDLQDTEGPEIVEIEENEVEENAVSEEEEAIAEGTGVFYLHMRHIHF